MDQEPDYGEPDYVPTEEEQRADAWEYWHQRAIRFEAGLHAISLMEGMTLLAPSLGPDCDQAHQLGANKAFNQAAAIAKATMTAPQPAHTPLSREPK